MFSLLSSLISGLFLEDLTMRYIMFFFICLSALLPLPAEETVQNQEVGPELLISESEILRNIRSSAAAIDKDYEGQHLTIVMIMKGAVCVTSELMKTIMTPFTLEYIRAKSNGSHTEPTVYGLQELDLTDKHVLVVDDIFVTGCTMKYVVEQIQKKNPKSVKSLVLLSKKRSRHFSFEPDYSLFEVGSAFVVGFGIDHEEKYRGLPGIYCLPDL
jgi:hypoxanthine phosphoribosyltransferase